MSQWHHKLALAVWLTSWVMAATGGLLFAHFERISAGLGLYWAIGIVTTSGGDLLPHTTAGYWVAGFTKWLAIPVWSLAFALATSWLMSMHVADAESRIKEHLTTTLSSGDS